MAIRKIVKQGDEILTKPCRPVEKFDEKLWQLLDDMAETMYKADGLGLAAPQVGVLRQIVVIDVGEGKLEVINPTISNTEGAVREPEGCLSVPNKYGYVTRPKKCTLSAQDRFGNHYERELSDMFCRCACHETDHLKGHLFTELVEEWVED
jgi:peptide deformylase